MIQDTTTVTMERREELVCSVSNGAISNDLVRAMTGNNRALSL